MGTQDFGTMDANATLKQVIDAVADLQDTLNFLLNGNLDAQNVRAKTITADRMKVQQLSAIAADLGTITAGIIYGAYIATSNGTFPRIEFSSVNRLLTAFSDANNHVDMSPNAGGTPGFLWVEGGVNSAFMNVISGIGMILSTFGSRSITIDSATDINLSAGNNLKINGSTGQTTSIPYVKNVVGGTPISGSLNFTKGVLTSYS